MPIGEVREIARRRELGERITFVIGNALDYEPPQGFDIVLVSNTLHMPGPDRSRMLLTDRRAGAVPERRPLLAAVAGARQPRAAHVHAESRNHTVA